MLLERGDPRAAEELVPIEYPFELEYLREWALDLYETADGPLCWREMEAWARLNDIRILPHEVRPLRRCVRALQARPATAPTATAAADPLDFDNDEDE